METNTKTCSKVKIVLFQSIVIGPIEVYFKSTTLHFMKRQAIFDFPFYFSYISSIAVIAVFLPSTLQWSVKFNGIWIFCWFPTKIICISFCAFFTCHLSPQCIYSVYLVRSIFTLLPLCLRQAECTPTINYMRRTSNRTRCGMHCIITHTLASLKNLWHADMCKMKQKMTISIVWRVCKLEYGVRCTWLNGALFSPFAYLTKRNE